MYIKLNQAILLRLQSQNRYLKKDPLSTRGHRNSNKTFVWISLGLRKKINLKILIYRWLVTMECFGVFLLMQIFTQTNHKRLIALRWQKQVKLLLTMKNDAKNDTFNSCFNSVVKKLKILTNEELLENAVDIDDPMSYLSSHWKI